MSNEEDYYVWQEQADDGRWGMISAYIANMGTHGPLHTRTRSIAVNKLSLIALMHASTTGHPIRLARYTHAETIQEHRPD